MLRLSLAAARPVVSFRQLAVAAAVVVALAGPMAVRADDARCGSRVITTGMSKSDVRDACGEPTSIDDDTGPARAGDQVVGQATQSRWTYATDTVTTVFVFDEDRLISIETD